MKYLLIVVLALSASALWLYRESTKGGSPDEDLGEGILSFVVGCAAAVAAVVYILIAFYRHQWL